MIFTRSLNDSLGSLRRFLRRRSEVPSPATRQPFQPIRTVTGEDGIISLVEGRNTPRALRSWIYCAKRCDLHSARPVVRKPLSDLHIYLDFLGPVPQGRSPKRQQERQEFQRQRHLKGLPTHRIEILKASHFLNEHGFYDYELLFWGDFDGFWPDAQHPDHLAQMAADRLAHRCLQLVDPLDLSQAAWTAIVQAIWQESQGIQTKQLGSSRAVPLPE